MRHVLAASILLSLNSAFAQWDSWRRGDIASLELLACIRAVPKSGRFVEDLPELLDAWQWVAPA